MGGLRWERKMKRGKEMMRRKTRRGEEESKV
jgi:hypothetical protein